MAGGACVGDARAREKWRCGGKFGRLTKKCETEQVVRKLVNWRETETMGRLRENSAPRHLSSPPLPYPSIGGLEEI